MIGDQSRGPSSQAGAPPERLVSRLFAKCLEPSMSVSNDTGTEGSSVVSYMCNRQQSIHLAFTHVSIVLKCINIPILVIRY